jgi:hypothetical protein
MSNWIPIESGTAAGGGFTFADLLASNFPRRYYRVGAP